MELGSLDLQVAFDIEVNKHQCVPKDERKSYSRKMLQALAAVHLKGVVHGDIKPSNFIVVGTAVKLIDFNLSQQLSPDREEITKTHDAGTLQYMSPDLFTSINGVKTMVTKIINKNLKWPF
jgi:serine/threonine protein kinase